MWGARTLDSQRGPREPHVRDCGFWWTGAGGRGPGWPLTFGVDSCGSCLAGVLVSDSQSCVFVVAWPPGVGLLPATDPGLGRLVARPALLDARTCPQVWEGPCVSSQEVPPGEKAGQSQRSGQSALSLGSFQQMVSLPFILQGSPRSRSGVSFTDGKGISHVRMCSWKWLVSPGLRASPALSSLQGLGP